jgi:sulfur-carrier protein
MTVPPDTLDIVYFAWVREAIGCDAEVLPHPAPATTVEEVIDILSLQSAAHLSAFSDRSRIRAALDQVFVGLDAPLGNAQELALFPPVTGG